MKVPDNIYLVGSMGAGKTTIGRRLAKALHKDFIDSDAEIEARTGADISLIFDYEGEAGFRKRENRMLEELTERQNIVLATGGGAVLDADNRARLMARGFVIYLAASLELLVERTARDRKRPLLQTEDRPQRLKEILDERDPLYRQVADLVISTDRRAAHHLTKDILHHLGER